MTQARTLNEAFAEICRMDGPLAERLEAYANKLRELNFPFAEAYDTLVARLVAGEVGTTAPRRGEPMPPFVLPAKSGQLIGLEDLTARGPVVVCFNRGHWCPFCKIQLRAIANYHEAIRAYGAEVVSIMPDRQQYLGELRADTFERLIILSDMDNSYALSLGLVMSLGERLRELMRGRGYHLDSYHGNDGWFVPVPATFVVGRDGLVVARFVDPDFRRRMEINDIIEALKTATA